MVDFLVSVYIPTFNRLELLQRAVDSVLNQTYKKLEIIIVDDGSSDGTHDYLKELATKDNRVKIFFKKINSGACESRNIAIQNATGYFITGLDDDDYFLQDRIEKFVNAWSDSYSCLFSINVFKKNENKFIPNIKNIPNIVYKKDLLKRNFIGNQVFTKTDSLRKIGGFDPNLKVWQDLDCWYRLLENAPAKKINFKLQVIDVSHPHERISKNKAEKVVDSYIYFKNKYKLSKKEILNLQTHLIAYKGVKLSKFVYLRNFLNVKDFKSFIKIFLFFFSRD